MRQIRKNDIIRIKESRMSNGEMKSELVAKSENAAVEFKRARGVVPTDSYCVVREGGEKGGKWIVKKAGR